jgi:PAS domain S-box-containing protein
MPDLKLEALLNISQIDLTTPLNQLLDEILTRVGREMQAHSGSVMLVNEETGELDMVATFGLPEDYIDRIYARGVLITCSPSGEVLKTGKFYEVQDIFEEPRDKWWADLARELGFSAQLFMPMKHNGRIIGLLNIYMAEPHEYTRDEIAFVSIAASQAAATIEHARLYAKIEKEKTVLESEIGEHKRVEELLWESKDILSNILSASPIGIGIVKERKLTWTNDRMLEMMGFKPDDDPYEYVGQSAEVIYASKEEYGRVGRIFYEGLKERDLVEVDAKLKRKDGSLFDGHIKMSFLDPSNPIKGAIATISDVSWRKKAEEALRESEAKYRGLAENLQDGLFILQGYPYPELKFCNEAFARMVGYTVEEMMALTIQRYVAPEDLEMVADNYRRRLDGEEIPREYEYRVLHKDGKTPVYVNMHAGLMEYHGTKATLGTVKDITERKRAEEVLRESEKKYKLLVETSKDMIFTVDLDGNFLFANKAFSKTLGYSAEETRRTNGFEFVHPDDLKRVQEGFARSINDKSSCNMEYRYKTKQGSYISVLTSISPIRNPQEEVVALLGVTRDITEKKRLEEELKQSEVLYRTFFEVTNAPTVILNEDGTFYKVNQEGAKISGFTKEELEGKKSWTEFIARKEDLEKMKEIHRLRREDPDSVPSHYDFLFKDRYGTLRDISVAAALIPGTKRSVVSFMDVTERKRAEEALQKSEEYYRSLIENASDGVMIADERGNLKYQSPSAERILGYNRGEQVGISICDNIHPEDKVECAEIFNQLIHVKDGVKDLDLRIRHKDGSWRTVSGTAKNLLDNPAVRGIVINYRDITERMLMRKELEESEERFRSLFDNLSVGIAMIDTKCQVVAVNKTACRFLDYSQEELIGTQLTTLIYPKDLEADREPFKPVIDGTEDHRLMDKRHVRKDGEIVWGRLHVSGIKDEEGQVKFMSVICEDITACKLVEEALVSKSEEMVGVIAKCKRMKDALQRSETKYKEIAEFLPDLIYKSILLDA